MAKRGSDFIGSNVYNPIMTIEQEAKKAKLDTAAAALYTSLMPTMNGSAYTAAQLLGAPLSQVSLRSANREMYEAAGTSSSQQRDPPPTPARPSKVVHLRNIPSDMVDVELVHFCLQYGHIKNYMLLKGKNQAFVEFEDLTSSTTMCDSLTNVPVQIRGRTMFAQFSMHQELKIDDTRRRPTRSTSEENLLANSNPDIAGGTQQSPNSVLRVIIENMLVPVTLDVLHGIFSRFGKVLRIITFNKNNTFQALVQLSEATSAQVARQALDNQNVYNGCCTLRIDYSKLATLNVKYNNDKSRDYTNPNLPSGELTLEQQISLGFPFAGAVPTAFLAPQQAAAALTSDFFSESLAAAQSVSPFITGLGTSALGVNGISGLTGSAGIRFPMLLNLTSVVLVSNLDEEKATPDALFTLFGVYGDVIRVKILFNKKDNALIQYSEPQQAQLAIQHLDKIKWNDKIIRVAASKHTTVQMPKVRTDAEGNESQSDAGLTRDYSHSPLHRFKKPGSKNYMNIYPPSSTLHLSNIPPTVNEEFLTEAFTENGFTPKAFKFFPKDHKMALMQLEDVEVAIDALIAMHNFKLAENAHLRVSFSKSGI